MRKLQGNQLDALITASLYRNISRDAEAFLSLDITGIEDSPHIKAKILRRSKNERSASWISTLRIAAVACLIIISMIFTACMCVPKVREAMWDAFVEWYDDYIHVYFKESGNAETSTGEGKTTEADTNDPETTETGTEEENVETLLSEPPNSIQKRAKASYLPEGYYAEENEVASLYADSFYFDSDGNMMFRLLQRVIDEESGSDVMIDNENDPVTTMYINGHEGIMVEYPDVPGLYYLVWQDESYQYSLYGAFESVSELMKIAEGIRTE